MRSVCEALAALAGFAVAMCAVARDARAETGTESTYGRIEGDLTLVAGVGCTEAAGGFRLAGELRVRYLESVGVFATYEDGAISDADPRRVLAGGLELRPFFVARWLKGLEAQRARLDLIVDSIGLELGTTFSQPATGGFSSRPGLEVALGLEVPILERATGPWIGLHGGLRWGDEALTTGVVQSSADREAFLAFTLAWHQVVVAHAVDVGDRAPR